jgi:hypothetical protein
MKMRNLMAIKPHKYGTRHLVAGDEYEVPPRQAVALVAARKAKFAHNRLARTPEPAAVEPVMPQPEPEPEPEPEITNAEPPNLDGLRMEAAQLGIEVDGRWGAARLQHEIAQAKS